jgi:hypothetical protein
MEHRWSARTPYITQVSLHHNSLPVAVCSVSNIGQGGLFVKTGALTYPKNSILEVDIKLKTDQGSKWFHLRTVVVYRSDVGLGLMFLDSNVELFRSIRQILLDGMDMEAPMDDLDLMPTSAKA